MKARSQPVSTVSFVPPAINTSRPDIDKIHSMIAAAIEKSQAKPAAGTKQPARHRKQAGFTRKKAVSGSTVGGSLGNLRQGYAANASSDLSSAC